MKLMVKVSAVLLASVLAVPAFAVEGDAEAGKGKAAACAACHGQDGNSAAAANPKLAGQSEAYLVKQLMDFKAGNRVNGIMQGMSAGLSEQDMADIAAYYSSQTITVGKANPDLVALGEKVYRGGNSESGVAACAGCHGPAGAGLPSAGFPALGGQHAGYIKAQLEAFRAAGRGDQGAAAYRGNDDPADQGMMRSVAAKMSDAEIEAVASFISGLGQ